MSNEIKHENTAGHGGFEHRDISARTVLYFFAALAVGTLLIVLFLDGMYSFLDKRERKLQPAVNTLVTNAPTDTRKVPEKYPESTFPDPRLETDERGQLNSIRQSEAQKLNSYDWVDEKAGIVRIPIERAMDLVAERGLPTRGQGSTAEAAPVAAKAPVRTGRKR